jgi:hypothetical protein
MSLKAIRTRLLNIDKGLVVGAPLETLRNNLATTIDMVDKLLIDEKLPAASQLGRLGGTVTAKRGPDYFRELAARRKTHGGGRPRKDAE